MKFNSLKTRLVITLLLMAVLPASAIGWMAFNMMSGYIRSDHVSDVGRVADAKHEQLVMVLTRANNRAKHFLSDLSAQCGGKAAWLNHSCVTSLTGAYLAAEGAIGANLRRKAGDSLTIGTSAVQNEQDLAFQTGQLAKFSSTGINSDHAYFVSVAEESTGLQLSITYPSSVLDPVFNPPPADLGLSGETFLADGEGYFVTQPKYPSTQGRSHPIAARPMQACLSKQNGEVLDQDYRDAAIIHGYRFIPEFGSACIMAHLAQYEAFAPVKLLERQLSIAIAIFCLILLIAAMYIAKNTINPVIELTSVTRAIAAGDVDARAEVAGFDEISELGTSFNFMTDQLHASREHLYRLLNSMAEGMYGIDTDGNCTFVNQAFLQTLGYQDDNEVLGKNMHELIHHSHADGSMHPVSECRIYRAFQTNQSTNAADEVFWRKDGVPVPVEYWSHPITAEGVTTGSIVTFIDITQRKKAEEDIYRLAFYDSLTSLPNRRLLLDRLQHALANASRSGGYGAIMFIDLDNFKLINDTKGHYFGDLLLMETALRLQSCVREGDTVSRISGDEFVVMLENLGSEEKQAAAHAEEVAEKIRDVLNKTYLLKELEVHSTASIGISLFIDRADTADSLLKHADIALYQAKESGRNAVRFFDPEMQADLEARTALEADLRKALAENQFRLYYQAQVGESSRIFGAEALVRWIHPQRGMVPPVHFIPVAEESSLILDIGQWVLETACQQLALWANDEQKCNLVLAVNVSARQFRLNDFVHKVAEVIKTYRIHPSRLKLELTESVVLSDVTDIVAKMHALKALGVGLSMDDFGTGYSSLSYLKRLPLDQLKIDKSFINDIVTDPSDAVMVQTIIAMAHNFRLNVIAEGVETEAQLVFLEQHGCMAYQGYLFSKPVPVEEFEALLKKMNG